MDAPIAAARRDQVELAYRYDFDAHELDRAIACFTEHGFAIWRRVVPPDVLADLRQAVTDVLDEPKSLAPGDNRTTPEFIERSPLAVRALDVAAHIELNQRIFGTNELTVHRSFAMLKNAGSPAVPWHRDYHHETAAEPTEPDQFLDPGDHGLRILWYLDGSYPDAGGLWLIPDSHREDWPGLAGFAFAEGRKSFFREGTEPKHYEGFDAPGMLPLVIDPGDLVIYSLKLYHGAAAQPAGVRRACAVVLRPTWPKLEVPWPEMDASRRFVAEIPERFQSLVTNYVGVDYAWRAPGSRPQRRS